MSTVELAAARSRPGSCRRSGSHNAQPLTRMRLDPRLPHHASPMTIHACRSPRDGPGCRCGNDRGGSRNGGVPGGGVHPDRVQRPRPQGIARRPVASIRPAGPAAARSTWRSSLPSAGAPTGTATIPIAAPTASIRTSSGPCASRHALEVETAPFGSDDHGVRHLHTVGRTGRRFTSVDPPPDPTLERVVTGGQARQRRSRS